MKPGWGSFTDALLAHSAQFLNRVLTTGHGGCTFTMSNADGSNSERGATADADEARAQTQKVSAFCYAWSRVMGHGG